MEIFLYQTELKVFCKKHIKYFFWYSDVHVISAICLSQCTTPLEVLFFPICFKAVPTNWSYRSCIIPNTFYTILIVLSTTTTVACHHYYCLCSWKFLLLILFFKPNISCYEFHFYSVCCTCFLSSNKTVARLRCESLFLKHHYTSKYQGILFP